MVWRAIDSLPYGVPVVVSDGEEVYALIAHSRDKKTGYVSTSAVGWSGGDMSPDFRLEDMTKWTRLPLPK